MKIKLCVALDLEGAHSRQSLKVISYNFINHLYGISLSTSSSDKFAPVRDGKHFTSNLDTNTLSFIFTMFAQSDQHYNKFT